MFFNKFFILQDFISNLIRMKSFEVEKERDKERQTDRQSEREREKNRSGQELDFFRRMEKETENQ